MTASEFKAGIDRVSNPLPGSTPAKTIYRLAVKQKFDKKNIIDFFQAALPGIAREIWIEKIKKGNITINNQLAALDTLVKAGEITEHTSDFQTEPAVSNEIKLIHYENDFIVVNKPAPLPMHPCGRFNKNSLISILNLAFPQENFKLIHRLDANTTGLAIIGRSLEATKSINTQFENKSILKEYLVLVEGILVSDLCYSEKSIGKELTKSGARAINNAGQKATTKFKVINILKEKNQTLVSAFPHNGRTNQIRLHLSDMGHPVVGDYGYKDPAYFSNNPLTYKEDCLFLHAWKLRFNHPVNHQEINFTAPIPAKFPQF